MNSPEIFIYVAFSTNQFVTGLLNIDNNHGIAWRKWMNMKEMREIKNNP
ncbi:hypothetical protein M979_2909 [Buttiauxella noackiae ATCC 51607]|uniref:Uncharacterized protein n=1 Tax=Buttiauxella noackiae ATCC 51607 TaxID=1354255 RepID=A0A1B7HK85_9ENTR|nr:hypothetical protein M979_2909 [Buttiauxella noackiae ATCC 51607]